MWISQLNQNADHPSYKEYGFVTVSCEFNCLEVCTYWIHQCLLGALPLHGATEIPLLPLAKGKKPRVDRTSHGLCKCVLHNFPCPRGAVFIWSTSNLIGQMFHGVPNWSPPPICLRRRTPRRLCWWVIPSSTWPELDVERLLLASQPYELNYYYNYINKRETILYHECTGWLAFLLLVSFFEHQQFHDYNKAMLGGYWLWTAHALVNLVWYLPNNDENLRNT